jgi:hypothetical protein
VKLISARLGHSSIQVTLDCYGHLLPGLEESLARELDVEFARASLTTEGSLNTTARIG